MIIGSHVGLGGKEKFLGSVKESLKYGSTALMVYTGAPQNTRRSPIDTYRIPEAHQLMKENGLDIKNIVVHAPYIMNLANPSEEKREFAVRFLSEEIRRTAEIGAEQIVLHPGSAVGGDRAQGLDWIVEGLKIVIEETKDLTVRVALETMAGKGNELGRTFEEIGYIINEVNSERLSVCFDTCHTNDAGYDLSDFDNVLAEFDKHVGREKISVFHVNDSKNPLGAAKDRHENFGLGYIGYDTLVKIINHPDFIHIPKILETPYVTESEDTTKKVYPPYKEEIEMIKSGTFNENLLDLIRENSK